MTFFFFALIFDRQSILLYFCQRDVCTNDAVNGFMSMLTKITFMSDDDKRCLPVLMLMGVDSCGDVIGDLCR